METVIIIPARLESNRFPNKILNKIQGLSMIEHVRRRCLLVKDIAGVYVATPNVKIQEEVERYGGNVILTNKDHENGTSRVAEAILAINCSHVILVQGDEPLILPSELDEMNAKIRNSSSEVYAWNGVSLLQHESEILDETVVKCSVFNERINYCFRKSPSVSTLQKQLKQYYKVMGLIAFRKSFLLEFSHKEKTPIESNESIEQLRIIEHGLVLNSVLFPKSLPSVNEEKDVSIVLDILEKDKEQRNLFSIIFNLSELSK
ncbi:NTP transferase domain-containing protein [Flavobacteriaceae bacterium]|nr:NTP transferase domain-containing protein [Flavobacteriaceae bacterium]